MSNQRQQLNVSNIIPWDYSGAGGPADCQDPEQELRRRRDPAAAQPGQLPQQLHAAGPLITRQDHRKYCGQDAALENFKFPI